MIEIPMSAAEIAADRERFVALARGWPRSARVMLGDVRAVSPATLALVRRVGVRAAVRVRELPPERLLPSLIELARRGVDAEIEAPWAPPGVRTLDDDGLGELLFSALHHAEARGDTALRAALDAHRGYRRLLAGVPRDPDDPLDLRWDVTHAPRGIPRLTFLLTRNCQLRCRYCMVKLWDEDAEVEDQQHGLELLFANAAPAVRMQFYGGEPLLRPTVFRAMVERARALALRAGKRLSIVLITNGIAMTEEIAQFCRRNDVEVLLSLDGPEGVTDRWRRPHRIGESGADGRTWGAAVRALGLLQRAEADVHVIVTVPPKEVDGAAGAFDHVRSLGVRTIQICYAMGVSWGEEATERLCAQLDQIAERHGEAVASGRLRWINLWRREPLLADPAVQLETDGRLCFMNECMFERLKPEPNYGIAHIRALDDLSRIGATRFHAYALLVAGYADQDPRYRTVLLDNLRVGEAVRDRLRERFGTLPEAGDS